MKGRHILISSVVAVAMLAMVHTASAQTFQDVNVKVLPGCALDWNGDGFMTYEDLVDIETINGMYYEWFILAYHPYYYDHFWPKGDRTRADWNGNGKYDRDDVYGIPSETEETEGYYMVWYIIGMAPKYMHYIPEWDARCLEEPVVIEECTSNADCGAEHYCAADGCLVSEGGTIATGVCEPRPTCCPDAPPIVCACSHATFDNVCAAAFYGQRVKELDAICDIFDENAACETDAECPQGTICEDIGIAKVCQKNMSLSVPICQ